MKKTHQWEAKTSRMEYLLVGDEQKRKMESKNAKKDDPRAANSSIPWVWLLKGGKEVFECKNVPPFVILIIWCRGGSPRRANLHFFFFEGNIDHVPSLLMD